MILTITANAALDRIMFIEEFRPGTTMRPTKMIHSVGGKGFDASVALRTFGIETLALGFVAGPTGQQLVTLLEGYGIRHDLVWVEGDTRLSHVLIERLYHRHSHIIAGMLPISTEAEAALLQRYQNYLDDTAWVIAAGTLPPGLPVTFYHRLIRMARVARIPILIDSVGPPFLAALAARPTILKLNRSEFAQTFGCSVRTLAELHAQAQTLLEREQLPALVLTCGSDGILALTPAESYFAVSPPQPAINAAGAGDTVSAILAWRFSLGESWPEALRWAAAVSAASVLTEGTADCRAADVERLLPQVKVESFN